MLITRKSRKDALYVGLHKSMLANNHAGGCRESDFFTLELRLFYDQICRV